MTKRVYKKGSAYERCIHGPVEGSAIHAVQDWLELGKRVTKLEVKVEKLYRVLEAALGELGRVR